MQLAVIVAVAENGTVGNNNALPWHLPGDLQYFKRITMGKPIVMGRKTFDSIGRPLPGRSNIVISRNRAFSAVGIQVVASFEEALRLATQIALHDGAEALMVIGGAAVYAAAIPRADRLYITEVHACIEGDARLPDIDWSGWREVSREHHSALAPNPYDYSYVVYDRVDC